MKILILGGTGAMGVDLIDILKIKGNDIYVTSRKDKKSESNVTYICGNAKDNSFLNILVEQEWDVIVDFMVYTTDEFANRVDTLLKYCKQYVFLSSSRVYAHSETRMSEQSKRLLDVTKDEKYLETDEYALAKARQENILFNSVYSNWTVIRPYITYSNIRLQLGVLEKEEWLFRALHGKSIVFCEEMLDKYTTMTLGYDVANGIASIIGKDSALRETFHITTNSKIKWSEVLDIYLQVLEEEKGLKPKIKLLNSTDFQLVKNAKYQIIYDRLYNRCFDNSKISNYTNINEMTPSKAGLAQCLKSFLKSPQFNSIYWAEEAKKDKLTNSYTSLLRIPGMKNKLRYIAYRIGVKH